ncbi:MAG: trehalose-phosphatase [Thermoplasmatales archaeon]
MSERNTLEEILKQVREIGGISKAFLDYDGTLVNITTDPDLAIPDDGIKKIVRQIGTFIPTYIVTGRALDDLLKLIGPGFNIIAMHGAQFCDGDGKRRSIDGFDKFVLRSKEIASRYSYLSTLFSGLSIKDKGGGVMFHYYHVSSKKIRDLKRAISSIREEGFEMYSGKYIFELRIKGINKGMAVENEMKKGDAVLFAGDDATDEEAFEMLREQITIKVGDGDTRARFRLGSPSDMRQFLSRILEERLFRVNA